jgi:hypothetical protein
MCHESVATLSEYVKFTFMYKPRPHLNPPLPCWPFPAAAAAAAAGTCLCWGTLGISLHSGATCDAAAVAAVAVLVVAAVAMLLASAAATSGLSAAGKKYNLVTHSRPAVSLRDLA